MYAPVLVRVTAYRLPSAPGYKTATPRTVTRAYMMVFSRRRGSPNPPARTTAALNLNPTSYVLLPPCRGCLSLQVRSHHVHRRHAHATQPTCGSALLHQQPRLLAAPAGASYGVWHGRSSSKHLLRSVFEEVFVFPASKAASLDLQEPTMTCAADHERHEHAHAHGYARGVGRCCC